MGRVAFNTLPFCVFGVNEAVIIQWVNNAGYEFFVSDKILGQKLSDVIKEKNTLNDIVIEVLRTGASRWVCKVDIYVVGVGAKVVDMAVSCQDDIAIISILKDYDGDGDLHSGVNRIVDVMAHEIKNPLAGIRGASQLLGEELTNLNTDRGLADLITTEVDRITNLVNTMENLSIQKTVNFVSVNIHKVLDKVVQLGEASWASKCVVTKQYDPSLPKAWGQEYLLIQCFINIFKNASESFDFKEKKEFNITIKASYMSGFLS